MSTQIGYQRHVGQEGANEAAYTSSVVPNGGAGSLLQGEQHETADEGGEEKSRVGGGDSANS